MCAQFSLPSLPALRLPIVPLVFLLLCVGGSCCHHASASTAQVGDRYDPRKGLLSDPDLEDDDDEGVEYMDPTPPQAFPTSDEIPTCSALLFQYDFAHTVGAPPVTTNYTPPENCKWNRVVLEFSASCAGEQNDRIAAVWLDGVEILRTSTAKPRSQVGVFWRVRKDITHYASLLIPVAEVPGGVSKVAGYPRTLSVMLENSVDDFYRGVYHVNITLDFYGRGLNAHGLRRIGNLRLPSSLDGDGRLVSSGLSSVADERPSEEEVGFVPVAPRYSSDENGRSELPLADSNSGPVTEQQKLASLLGRPADVVIPIANQRRGGQSGFWFRIDRASEIRGSKLQIPRNAYKAVLEVYVSSHGDDEFWYANPPDTYNIQNNIPTRRGNWAFREVIVTVDGLYAGSVLPFPVVFPGAINPFFWTPVVAIKAFDMPTYDIDLTPFLGNLLNGRPHTVGFKVDYAISYWLVNANLHLWLDPRLPAVPAMLVKHHAPHTFVSRNANNKYLDGHFQLEAARQARFEGWARSSLGNFTTLIDTHFKYKSSVEYKLQGTLKEVFSQSKYTADVRITEQPNRFLARVINQARYPVKMLTSTAGYGDRLLANTNLSHILYEFTDITLQNQMRSQSSVTDTQQAGGWLQADGAALSGSATTLQTYQRRDNGRCHTRKVSTQDGGITADMSSTDCNMGGPEPTLVSI